VQAVKQKQTFTVQKTEKTDPINELLNRGWTAFQRGEYDSASKAYNKVLQREARNRDALLGIAAVSVRRGETEKARENYLELLELDPLDPYAHAGLASIAQTEGASLSESRLKQLIEKQPDGAHLQFVLGNLYAQQDKWPQAQQAYFTAWQGDNENADYAFNLAVSLDHLKKYNEAERFYQSSLNLAHNRKTGFSVDAVENRLQLLRAVKK
jgi:tetratricopeptide (TPR) repeat protein